MRLNHSFFLLFFLLLQLKLCVDIRSLCVYRNLIFIFPLNLCYETSLWKKKKIWSNNKFLELDSMLFDAETRPNERDTTIKSDRKREKIWLKNPSKIIKKTLLQP
jgi:hypothetical protein